MFSKIFICLALFALVHGLNEYETELYNNVESCCKDTCSGGRLEHLHNSLSQYMKTEDVDTKLVEFGAQVLGGKRCSGDPRVVKNQLEKAENTRTRANGNIWLNCPYYVEYGTETITCGIEISDPETINSVFAFAQPESSQYDYLPCSVSNNTGNSFFYCEFFGTPNSTYFYSTATFSLNGTTNSLNVTVFYTTEYWGNYSTPAIVNIPIYGVPTTSPTATPGNTTDAYMNISCPTSVTSNSGVSCLVTMYSPSGIYYGQVNSNSNAGCNGCYGQYFYGSTFAQYYVQIYSDNFQQSINVTGYFYTPSYQTTMATPATIDIINPYIVVTNFSGPSVLPSNFNTFNISFTIESDYEIRSINVDYYNSQNNNSYPIASAYYYNYYNYNSTYNNTFSLSAYRQFNVTAGEYCAIVSIYDVSGSYYRTAVGSCFTILSTGCFAGYYSSLNPTTGKYKCIPCPQGFYAASSDSLRCDACPAGSTSACVLGSRSCVTCPPGTSSSKGVCKPCAEGTYSYSYGQPTCTACRPGQFANSTGNTYCNYCTYGTYSNAGAGECTVCPAGTYSPYYEASICQKCYDGYSSTPGSYSCFQCPENTYAVSGSGKCTPCPAGQTSPPGSFACYAAKK